MSDQPQRLYAVAGVADAFHPPVPNNYVLLLIPRRHDPERYIADIAASTTPLNAADEALLACCAARLAAFPDPIAQRAVDAWRQCHTRRVNLQSVRFATEVAARFEHSGQRFAAWLQRDHPEVLARFVDVPDAVLDVVRINGYVDPDDIEPTLQRLVAALADPELATVVDRLEVARLDLPRQRIDFPTLIVYLDGNRTTVKSATARLAEVFAATEPGPPPRTELAQRLTHNATLTEGFTLYKRYLRLVGLLDELYDRQTNYALARRAPGSPSPHASAARCLTH